MRWDWYRLTDEGVTDWFIVRAGRLPSGVIQLALLDCPGGVEESRELIPLPTVRAVMEAVRPIGQELRDEGWDVLPWA
ncbi:hypothetical protein ACIP5N_27605 [Streptomyces sp. NPDC088768]|uniref:hypothetical protein n=1 Tax=Streptomyces sp. NPDC088768 TaxID=3365894 RepID=UPI0038016768